MSAEPRPQPFSDPVSVVLRRWLTRGWRDFRRVPGLSMGYSAGFLLVGAAGIWLLAVQGRPLLGLPFLAGFLLLAPLFALGFYQFAVVLDQGGRPGFTDPPRAFARAGAGAWAIGFLLAFCYLVWITDALLLYTLSFGTRTGLTPLDRLNDPALVGFLAWSAVTGFVLALGLYLVAVLSLPRIFAQGANFSEAIGYSVRRVFRYPRLLLSWGLVLAVGMFVSLLLVPPLFVVVYPVLAYAGYRGCQEVAMADADRP